VFICVHLWLNCLVPAQAANHVVAWGAGTNVDKSSGSENYGQSLVPAALTNAVLVAGGRWHSMALNANGTLTGWGDATLDQTNFPAGSNYASVACGQFFSLALKTSGTVVAVGDDTYGQTDVPSALSNVVAIACGWYHCLALRSDGTVVSWGTSTNPADFGTDDASYGQCLVPAGLSNVVAVAGGGFHSLALKADGTVTAWGATSGSADYGQSVVPTDVSNVVAISAGAADSMALAANGRLIAWGDNTYGQTNVPANLTNGIAAIASGGWHNLALRTNGVVTAWGAGVGTSSVDYGQTNVPGNLTNVIQIAAGFYHSLALVGNAPPRITVPLVITESKTNIFTVAWPTRNGRVYRLEYSSALINPTWKAFPLEAGTGGTNRLTDTNGPAAERFYRVSRW
jgi:alpha-tubulin suppressor-like RCC1 family protein